MHLKVILFTLTKYRITLAKKQDKKKLIIFIKIQISRKRDVTKKQVQGFTDYSTETIRIG